MSLSDMPWGEMVASALGGGGVAKVVDILSRRGRTKAYTMGAVDHAVQTAMTLVTGRLERVEAQHSKCEESLEKVREELGASKAEWSAERAELKAEIERLMQMEVAAYRPTDLRRPKGRRDA